MSFLIVAYLVLVIVAPLVLSAVVSYRTLPDERSCPLCGGETIPLLARWLRRVSAVKPGAALQRRWCPTCRWEGLCRLEDRPTPVLPDPTESSPRSGHHPSSTTDPIGQAIDLRRIDVDGRQWQVLLQTWCDSKRWYGRLLFAGPSGKLWPDRSETFSGSSPLDVLGQVLALPDGVLTSRLRDVISSAP